MPRTRAQKIRQVKMRKYSRRFSYRKHLTSMIAGNGVLTSPADTVSADSSNESSYAAEHSTAHYDTAAKTTAAKTRAQNSEQSSENLEQAVAEKKHTKPRNPITHAWRSYKNTKFYQLWSRRPKFSYGSYAFVFVFTCLCSNLMLLWSMDTKNLYDPKQGPLVAQIFTNMHGQLTSNAGWMNFFAIAMIYLAVLTIINRFWLSTGLVFAVFAIYSVANGIKLTLRDEIVLPSDLNFLTGGGEGNLLSFVPDNLQQMIGPAVTLIVSYVAVCIVLQFLDKRNAFIYCSWRHPLAGVKNIFGTICRILAPVLSVMLLVNYTVGLTQENSASQQFLNYFGYSPQRFNTSSDASRNGALTAFMSLIKVEAMENEPGYSKSAMQQIEQKYAKEAQSINAERSAKLTDNTVINILSESYADPTRVPGVSFSIDPMPNIRSVMNSTTSGTMLSPGYGGGTANIEFQQMTGLSMANFTSALATPYQQLVPNRSTFYSFNQMWNDACGSTACSVAFHPYYQNMYLRGTTYTKFGFSHFYALNSKPKLTHTKPAGSSHYASDEQSYQNVLDELNTKGSQSKFIELITMQNHTPYQVGTYGDNEFVEANTSTGLADSDKAMVETYAKGMRLTDTATANFLNELNKIDRPITVVFYGDHLPGIYSEAMKDTKNNITMHETDYFIWSNTASKAHSTKLSAADAAYTSSNYFMAETAEHLDAQVSPYLALLTRLHEEIPAMARLGRNDGEWKNNSALTMLDSNGKVIDESKLSAKAKELLEDYKMVQYDMCVGKNYLQNMGFMSLPTQ